MGQITDSITTPIIGYICDNYKTQYGQRTLWYGVGYIIVIFSFPLIFYNIGRQ
jgi:Na+/melibiose symporter-like transporter